MHVNYQNCQRTTACIARSIICMAFLSCVAVEAKPPAFTDVRIIEPFKEYLLKDPLLMESPGAKIINLRSGKTLIVGVAATPVGDKSPAQRIAVERILRLKADREIITLTGKVLIAVEEVIDDVTVITIKDGKEIGKDVERYRLKIKSTISQRTKSLPCVGRWNSPDGELMFYAVGTVIDPKK